MSALAAVPPLDDKPRLVIDLTSDSVTIDGRAARLSRKETDLLVALAREPSRLREKIDLLSDVWGIGGPNGTPTVRTLDSHATRLRTKLGCVRGHPEFVINTWGRGYRLVVPGRESEVLVVGDRLASPESSLGKTVLESALAMEKLGETLTRLGGELRVAGRAERNRLESAIDNLKRERRR